MLSVVLPAKDEAENIGRLIEEIHNSLVNLYVFEVVVVDDDADMRLFSTTVLEENGFSPIEAAKGEEGMEAIKNENPALVILDVLMPRESGVRLYRKLKSDKNLKHIPVIILSNIVNEYSVFS